MDLLHTGPIGAACLKFALIVLAPLVLGFALSLRLRGAFFLGERVLLGLVFGLAIFTAINFLAALAFGVHTTVVIAVLLSMLLTAAVFLRAPTETLSVGLHLSVGKKSFELRSARAGGSRVDLLGFIVFTISMLVFSALASRLIIWQNGTLATGYLDAWGDLPLHLSLVTSFLNEGPLPLRSTILAGEPLTYPFLSDFFSAMLMKLGLPLDHAIELPTVLLNSVTLTLLYYLGYRLVRHRAAAALAPALLLFAGGLGFLWFLSDLYYAPKSPWEFLQHLPRRYTNLGELKIHWVNPVLAHLLPQRSFLFGFPLGLAVILLWWNQAQRKRPQQAAIAGIIAGSLPLFHAHTFMALMMAGAMFGFLAMLRRETRRAHLRYWLVFGAAAALMAAPSIIYLLSSQVSVRSIRWHPGWMAEGENWVWFWLKNLGAFIPLLLVALASSKLLRIRARALRFYLPFGALFVICNLLLFSVFAYDTNKVLIFWFMLSLPFVARLLLALYRSTSWWLHGFAFRALLLALIFSGGLNLLHEFQNGGWPELTAEEAQLAQQLRKETPAHATFLTAPMHNNLLTLAGRGVVLGYPGHVISHGLDAAPIEQAIAAMFGGDSSAMQHLLEHKVDYIVLGPNERQRYGEKTAWLEERFPLFAQGENYRVYKVEALGAEMSAVVRKISE
jgi:hypothetical protein